MKAIILFLTLISINAFAGNILDSRKFYAARKGQVLKKSDIRELHKGNIVGDEIPYAIWDGNLSGKNVNFELHGVNMRLNVENKVVRFTLKHAITLPGGDIDSNELNPTYVVLFAKSSAKINESLICVESLGPDTYRRPRPYWEVYIIKDPLGKPQLYRISGINASCTGIERSEDGKLLVPRWSISKKTQPNVVIKYYKVEKNGFGKTGVRITGSIASEDAQDYIFDK